MEKARIRRWSGESEFYPLPSCQHIFGPMISCLNLVRLHFLIWIIWGVHRWGLRLSIILLSEISQINKHFKALISTLLLCENCSICLMVAISLLRAFGMLMRDDIVVLYLDTSFCFSKLERRKSTHSEQLMETRHCVKHIVLCPHFQGDKWRRSSLIHLFTEGVIPESFQHCWCCLRC